MVESLRPDTSLERLPIQDQQTCKHSWKLDVAAGPTSLGICDHCHLQREFRNSLPDDFSDYAERVFRGKRMEI